jgi:hypothetical protein
VRIVGAAAKLWVGLGGDEKWVVWGFDKLYEFAVRGGAADDETSLLYLL